jgi:hypothetical protein
MKFLLPLLFMLFSINAQAAELTPEQKLKATLVLANAATALVVGPVAVPYAIIKGQKKELCDVLGGKYRPDAPQGEDQCPGGVWLRIIPYLAPKG